MLQQNALLVVFSASQWTARKLDKQITTEVHTTHNAKDDAGRYNKLLVAKEHTEPISKAVNKARTFHYDNTLPWGNNNERLLPIKNYFEYLSQMNIMKADFERAVRDFLSNYDTVIAQAQLRLNGMFRQSDYPTRREIEDKFNFGFDFMPVPSNDIRVDIQVEELEKIKADVEAAVNTRLSNAVREIWSRINETLSNMRNKLADSEAVFRDSLFGNVNELVQLIPNLNVTNDPAINDICRQMADLKYSPDQVRSNPTLRATAAREVDAILNKFNSFF